MKLHIEHQESYSRGELLLRSFFGFIYIMLPHMVVMWIIGIWASILAFIAFWVILFTGRYPESWFEFQVKFQSWGLRLNATLYNLVDGYPAFGVNGTSDRVKFEVPYPESLGRGHLLLKTFFGGLYCALPHVFVWYFRMIATGFLSFLAWWAVLFTGSYPAGWHEFNVGSLRWITRVGLYLNNMTDDYPPFSGKEL